jgi:molybdate transport repressor ModE-like protein
MDFDLTDLRLLDEVLQAGSITAGARAANLSLAAASTRLRDLEIRTGVMLMERHRRGVRPTAAGAALHEHARRMLAETRAIATTLREHNRLLRGDLRLAVNTAAPYHALPELLAAFLIGNPGFDLAIAERSSGEALEAVRAHRADLAIVADHVDFGGLACRAWRRDCLDLVLPPEHRLAKAGVVSLAEVAEEPFLGLGDNTALQRLVEDRAARGVGRLRIRARLGNAEQLLRMVAAGAGLAIVPQVVLEAAGHRVARARLDERWAERQLHLVWSGERLSPPLKRLIEHIAAPE